MRLLQPNSTFSVHDWSSLVEFKITRYNDLGQNRHEVAKTLTMCPFPLFVALRDHNSPMLHTDGSRVTSCL